MTGDCMGELEEPANCANDIFAFLVLSGNSGLGASWVDRQKGWSSYQYLLLISTERHRPGVSTQRVSQR